MTAFKFEGEIEMVAEPQRKLIESVLQKHGFKDGKVTVESVGQKGDNYAAHVKRFIYETNEGSTFKMIGKIAPTSEILRKMMNTVKLFKNETIMYNEVLPKLNKIQNVSGVTEKEKVKFPVCYGIVTEPPFEFVLLEDLNESGFQMLDRSQLFTNDCVRMVLRDLAIFHSLSYVLKKNEPETFKSIVKGMTNRWLLIGEDPKLKPFLKIAENDVINLVDDEKYKNVMAGSISQIGELAKKILSQEEGSPFTVIQQGDCWSTNILFRFKDGKPIQNIMIDYQLSKESSPAADILYLIINCTDHSTRLKHYREWIDYYYEVLDNSLARHGLQANHIYPRYQLDADLKMYTKMTVGFSVMLSTLLVRKSEEAVDFKGMTGSSETVVENARAQMDTASMGTSSLVKLKERMVGIVDSVLEFELL